jgi:hypothetical protein
VTPPLFGRELQGRRPPEISAGAWQLLINAGAHEVRHSGRTLLDHLVGTARILQRWQVSEATRLAGLFHSIYGTNAFAHQALPLAEHAKLSGVIGAEAEHLARIFSSIDRPTALLEALHLASNQTSRLRSRRDASGAWVVVSRQQLAALAVIECANLVEQNLWIPAVRDFFCCAVNESTWLPPLAMDEIQRGLESALWISSSTGKLFREH